MLIVRVCVCACVRVCVVTGLYWQDAGDMHNCAVTLRWQEQMDTRVDLLLTIVQTLSSQLAILQSDTARMQENQSRLTENCTESQTKARPTCNRCQTEEARPRPS